MSTRITPLLQSTGSTPIPNPSLNLQTRRSTAAGSRLPLSLCPGSWPTWALSQPAPPAARRNSSPQVILADLAKPCFLHAVGTGPPGELSDPPRAAELMFAEAPEWRQALASGSPCRVATVALVVRDIWELIPSLESTGSTHPHHTPQELLRSHLFISLEGLGEALCQLLGDAPWLHPSPSRREQNRET